MKTKRHDLNVALLAIMIIVLLSMIVSEVLINFAYASGPGDAPSIEGCPPIVCPEFLWEMGPNGPSGHRDGFKAVPGHMGFARHLNLSREQQDKIKELRSRHFRETRDLRYEMAMRELGMQKLFAEPKVDETMLLDKLKELNVLRRKLNDHISWLMIEERKLLTNNQIATLDQMPFGPPGPGGTAMMPPCGR